MREGTALRVMAADMPYDYFYDFHSVSPEYFGYPLVYNSSYVLYVLVDGLGAGSELARSDPFYYVDAQNIHYSLLHGAESFLRS
jgi:hypothetical protein